MGSSLPSDATFTVLPKPIRSTGAPVWTWTPAEKREAILSDPTDAANRHAQPLSNDQTGKGGWKTDSGPGRTEITGKHQIIVKNKERGGRSRASAAKSAGNAKARNTRGGLLVGIFARVSRFRKSNFQLRGHSRQCNTCGTLTINANTTPKTTTTRTGQD